MQEDVDEWWWWDVVEANIVFIVGLNIKFGNCVNLNLIHTAKEISNQAHKLRNHVVFLKLTNTHVNLLDIKQDYLLYIL